MSKVMRNAIKRLGLDAVVVEDEETSVQYSRDGVPINEEDLTFNVMSLATESLTDRSRAVELHKNTVAAIEDIRYILADKKNFIVTESVREQLTLTMNRLLVESQAEASVLALENYTISTEGFMDVLKNIWKAITGFIIGFFKAILNFFKAIFGISNDDEKEKIDVKKKVNDAKRLDLKLPEDASKISSNLCSLIGIDNPEDIESNMISGEALRMYDKYEELFKNTIYPALDLCYKDVLPNIRNVLSGIQKTPSSDKEFKEIVGKCMSLTEVISAIRTEFTTIVTNPSSLPVEVIDKLQVDNSSSINYEIRSLVDQDNAGARLARDFNIYTVYNKDIDMMMLNPKEYTEAETGAIRFSFASYKNAKDNSSENYLKPLATFNDSEILVNKGEQANKTIDKKKLEIAVKRVTDFTTDILKAINDRGVTDISRIKDVVTEKSVSFKSVVLDVIFPVMMKNMNGWLDDNINIINSLGDDYSSYFTNLYSNIKLMRMRESKVPYEKWDERAKTGITSSAFTPEELLEVFTAVFANQLDGIVVPANNVLDLDIDEWVNVDRRINECLKESIYSLKTLLETIGADGYSSFKEFDVAVTKYTRESLNRLR